MKQQSKNRNLSSPENNVSYMLKVLSSMSSKFVGDSSVEFVDDNAGETVELIEGLLLGDVVEYFVRYIDGDIVGINIGDIVGNMVGCIVKNFDGDLGVWVGDSVSHSGAKPKYISISGPYPAGTVAHKHQNSTVPFWLG